MTNAEAYKWLYVHFAPCGDETQQDAAVTKALEALEKQIPQKPKEKPEKDNNNLWHLYCPSCENWIGMWNSRVKHGDMYNNSNIHICPYCGQAIDWEGES